MRWCGRFLLVLSLGVLAAGCHQNETVFSVDTTLDTVDSNPGDGFCSDASGDCSLRAAVMEANALPGVEEIRLVDGARYQLTIEGAGENQAAAGDLDVTGAVVVSGDATLVSTAPERLLHVLDAGGLVEIDGLDFQDLEYDDLGDGEHQYGILVEGPTSTFSLRNSDAFDVRARWLEVDGATAFLDSSAVDQSSRLLTGGIAVVADGTLFLTNVSLDLNNELWNDGGTLSVRHSTLSGRLVHRAGPSFDTAVANSAVVGGCYGAIRRLGGNIGFSCNSPGGLGPDDAGLLPLADYGGGARTFAVPPDSPAFDGGVSRFCLAEDARGISRPVGGACDSGAFESRPSPDCTARGPGLNLRFCNFSQGELNSASIPGAELLGAEVGSARDADLSGVDFGSVTLGPAPDFTGATLDGVRLSSLDASVRVDEASLRGSELSSLRLSARGADFSNAILDDVELSESENAVLANVVVRDVVILRDIRGMDFSGISGTARVGGSTEGANVDGAALAGFTFVRPSDGGIVGVPASLPPGVILVRGYLLARGAVVDDADLSGEDLSGATLARLSGRGANFSDATFGPELLFTDFFGATLDRASMADASMDSSRFSEASLVATDFRGSGFFNSDFSRATVVGVDFTNADLEFVRFESALMLWNVFDNTICPSGVNSDDNGGNCDGQFTRGEPLPAGAPVPEEFQGREAEFTTLGGNQPAE